jgi:hypothetical protein
MHLIGEKNGSYGTSYPSYQLLLRISTEYNNECSAAAEMEIFELGLFSNHPKYATNKWVVPLIERIELMFGTNCIFHP